MTDTVDRESVVAIYNRLTDGKWKEFLERVFSAMFGVPTSDWRKASSGMKAIEISNGV